MKIIRKRLKVRMSIAATPILQPELVRDELLHEIFEASVDRDPLRIAILENDVKITYGELEAQANRLAHFLRQRGVQPEDRVALFLPRSACVYAAMLGVLKAGAAYVPLDADIPAERARFIVEDCGARFVISLAAMPTVSEDALRINLDPEASFMDQEPSSRIPRSESGTAQNNLCYLIYTSGTTGRPKGVQIEHRQAAHLVRAESALFGIRSEDRVFQLASVAFDASVEEIWLAFAHGATLVVGTKELIQSGSDFSKRLTRLGVTVLSCVPTFLSMLEGDIPSVRLLIFGGETCPPELAARWMRGGRAVYNTYGPTEATVIATAARLVTGQPVTIGRPIPNYRVVLVDDAGQAAPDGVAGEIYIGGEGVARGYLRQPDLTGQRFVILQTEQGPGRFYRSGDRARWTEDGSLEYLGRLDGQVKVRGFRIELSEIESVLRECKGVWAAAASVHEPTQQIAAYVMLSPEVSLDREEVRKRVESRLPAYMRPAFLDILPALPTTLSGKIDRSRLPAPILPLLGDRRGSDPAPRNDAERTILEVWKAVLRRDSISTRDDFFLHLGGHSMLAAMAVSKLRLQAGFEHLSVADLYANPTAQGLARKIEAASTVQPEETPFAQTSRWRYRLCSAGQAAGVLILSGIYAWQWLGAFLTYGYLAVADWPLRHALLGALCVYLGITPAILTLSIATKWLLLGHIRSGRYPLWGWYYWRFWFVRSVVRAAPVQYLAGTPFINVYYRLMGARIGHGVYLGGHGLSTFDLLTVGDGSSVGTDTNLDGATVEGGWLKIAPVTIGNGCWVGNRCALGANAVLEDGSGLGDLSMLPDKGRIPAGELWRGSPARPAGRLETTVPRYPWTVLSGILQLTGIILFPLLILIGIFPGLMAMTYWGHRDLGFTFLVGAPIVAISFVLFLCFEVWAFKWLMFRRLREGRYEVGGWFYIRLWFYDQLMALSLEVLGTFYTTQYVRPWLNALGARIGPRSEISTIRLIHPDLLETGAECFLADDVMVGTPRVHGGYLTLGRTRLGERTFVGNSAVLPTDTDLGSNILVGALSIAPEKGAFPPTAGCSWFGSPPILLPSREKHQGFPESALYRPPKRLVAARLLIEFFRIILPSTIFVVLASLIVNATDVMQDHMEVGAWLLALPFLYLAAGLLSIAAAVLIKETLVGTYRVGEKPLWSTFVWRTELVTGVYENLAVLFFVNLLRGTPFIAWVLRAFGMKIGSRCYIDTTWFTEFDLITIGNEVALNDEANIQTHLFEDRVMKMGQVHLGDRCSIGALTTVLYDTQVGKEASLGELSLLMKGESLADHSRWHGIPARHSELP